MLFKYKICGLKISSEIEIPILRDAKFQNPDFQISFTEKLNSPREKISFQKRDDILFKDKNENIFKIDINSNIFIEKNFSDPFQISSSIIGVPIGFALQRKGFQVFHGSSVASDKSAVCFVCESTAGKSSLALKFFKKGLKMVTEDLCVMRDGYIFNFSDWIKIENKLGSKYFRQNKKIKIPTDSRRRSLFLLSDKDICKRKKNVTAIIFLKNDSKRIINELKPSEAFKYLFTFSYKDKQTDIKTFEKLTSILNRKRFFLFSRNKEKSLESNSRFLFNYLTKKDLI